MDRVTIRHLVVVLHPGILGILLRFDARQAAVVQVLKAIRDPIDVLLAREDHLAFDAGLCGPVIMNRLGKPAIMIPR